MGLFDNSPAPDIVLTKQDEGQAEGAGAQEGQQDGAPNPNEGGQQQTEGQQGEGQQQPAEQLILGKFKTPEEAFKAYENLEASHGRLKNELGQLRKQMREYQSQSQAQPQQGQGQPSGWTEEQWHEWGQRWYEEFMKNPGRAVFNLAAHVAQSTIKPLQEQYQALGARQAEEQAIDSELELLLTASDEAGQPLFPDAEQLADQIDAFLDENPYFRTILAEQGTKRAQGLLDDGYLGAVKVIYDAVKSQAAQEVGKQAFHNGLQAGVRQARQKAGAALPGVGAKKPSAQVSPEEQILNEIFAHKKGGLFG